MDVVLWTSEHADERTNYVEHSSPKQNEENITTGRVRSLSKTFFRCCIKANDFLEKELA